VDDGKENGLAWLEEKMKWNGNEQRKANAHLAEMSCVLEINFQQHVLKCIYLPDSHNDFPLDSKILKLRLTTAQRQSNKKVEINSKVEWARNYD